MSYRDMMFCQLTTEVICVNWLLLCIVLWGETKNIVHQDVQDCMLPSMASNRSMFGA